MSKQQEIVGVIGAGSFGIALANILAENCKVLLFSRREQVKFQVENMGQIKGNIIHENVEVTNEIEQIPQRCTLIFPVIPSQFFREVIVALAPYLKPWHIVIHGTKGLVLSSTKDHDFDEVGDFYKEGLAKEKIKTMSELIVEESAVVRVGCVAGPNLANEIMAGFPSAAVVASQFDEVIREGQEVLRSKKFRVHGSHDLLGIELAGVLKNIIAIASGILEGIGLAHNTRALLFTHGISEMATIGKAFGANPRAFLGLAGIGDLFATCSSSVSRNFTVGYLLAKGNTLSEIEAQMDETAEGVKTTQIIHALAHYYGLATPITYALYDILYHGKEVETSINTLMELPVMEDVTFL